MKFNNAFLTSLGNLCMQFDVQGASNMRKKCYQGSKESLITVVETDQGTSVVSHGFPDQTEQEAKSLFDKLKYKYQ